MELPPDTVITVSADEEMRIRNMIRSMDGIDESGHRVAVAEDAEGLLDLLSDPKVNGPLYTIPNDVTLEWVQGWIDQHLRERAAGEGVLMITRDEGGQVMGFADLQVWPDRASAEMGGGMRASLQNKHRGSEGAGSIFMWLFKDMGIQLLAMTCAEDNVRTQKLLTKMGFTQGKSRDCTAPDGSTRPSLYFELLRPDIAAARAEQSG